MKELLTLGDFYVSDFIKGENDYVGRSKFPLNLVLDESIGAARLTTAPPHNQMWGKYWYRSGINSSMRFELKCIAEEASSRIHFQKDDVWLDIACNDGTMFNYIPNYFIKLGIDPADDTFHAESSKLAKVYQGYFNTENYWKIASKKAKIITTIAMFYDLENPHSFIEDIKACLDDDGIYVIQLSYTSLMLKQLAFDNICHEHFYYYDLSSLKKLFNSHGMVIVDALLNDTNGGSIRVYFQKEGRRISSFASAPLRDVCNYRVESILNYEKTSFNLSDEKLWKNFGLQIDKLKKQTVDFIREEKTKGKVICGYGASTKGNTLLQLFGLDNTLIDSIAERSHYKYGLKTIGTDIPILSEEEVRAKNPDYLLILPWHFVSEFVKREQDFLNKGGKFIIPCPKFEIIGK